MTEEEMVGKTRVGLRGIMGRTLMIVPSFAAAGFGSIPAPGLYGTSSPS
jgi:hypothetical protein